MSRHRLAIVASHVIQYQDPFFRLLAADPEIDLEVLYCSPQGAVNYRDEDMKTTLRWSRNCRAKTCSSFRAERAG